MIGFSLGSGVVTYAAEYARENYPAFGNNISHLTLLDSPWHLDRPAGTFLEDTQNEIFLDNYYSQLGKISGYREADTNVYLLKGTGLPTGHGYARKWYLSSITNFQDKSILEDLTQPSDTRLYGFYWWDESTQADAGPVYTQIDDLLIPHWGLVDVEKVAKEVVGGVVDAATYTGEIAVKTAEKINALAQRIQKKMNILAVNTFNAAVDVAEYTVDHVDHDFLETVICASGNTVPCGVLKLVHASEAVVNTTVTIPADANMMAFAYEYQYALPGSTLELLIEDLLVFRALSHEMSGEGYRLSRLIDVSQIAGQEVTLTFRLSHPDDNTEGALIIDDLIFAKVEDIDSDGDLIPDLVENRVACYDPEDADIDDDGIADGVEDTDQNGKVDEGETDPCNADSDSDGIQDGTELGVTAPVADPDGGGPLKGTDEGVFQPDLDPATTTDPLDDDSDDDGTLDGSDNCPLDAGKTDPITYFRDQDEDGYGDPENTTAACARPAGYIANGTDCNDGNASIHPSATETCNQKDDDCDGQIDEKCVYGGKFFPIPGKGDKSAIIYLE